MNLFGTLSHQELYKSAENTFSHTKTLANGRTVDVVKLVSLLNGKKTKDLALTDIKGPSRSKRSGFSQKRYDKVDTDMPGIVDRHNQLIDGRHRYFKRTDQGLTHMPVHVASKDLIRQATI